MPGDVKAAAISVIESLPDNATWEDVQYHLYVRQQIDAGLADEAAGRFIDIPEMRARLEQHKALKTKAAAG
jgi:predicted transcriptional regulator